VAVGVTVGVLVTVAVGVGVEVGVTVGVDVVVGVRVAVAVGVGVAVGAGGSGAPSSARLCSWPTARAITLVRPAIWMGVRRLIVVPSPSSPLLLRPQAQAVPSARSARLW
jgi:hypothetical protein